MRKPSFEDWQIILLLLILTIIVTAILCTTLLNYDIATVLQE
jgi:hypothetical protein